MRKIFVFALSIVLLFTLQLSFPKAYAVCSEGTDDKGTLITAQMTENNPKLAESIKKCTSITTAIGPISTDPAKFVQSIYGVVLGLAGGIALILIILSGYKLMVSQGNPEKMKGATEGLTSAIIGLLFIIFAFVILQVVGVDILRIPGFSP